MLYNKTLYKCVYNKITHFRNVNLEIEIDFSNKKKEKDLTINKCPRLLGKLALSFCWYCSCNNSC